MPEGLFSTLSIILLLALVSLSAFFSAIETAFFSLKSFQVHRLVERNPRLGQALRKMMENPRRLLSAILLMDALVNLPLIIFSIYLLRGIVPGLLPFWMKALVIFAIIVLVCDLGPKLLALGNPVRVATIGVQALRPLMPLLDPTCRVLQRLSDQLAARLTPSRFAGHQHLSGKELGTLVELTMQEGALQATESEMIQEIIKLGEKTVKDCMTPRTDMFALADDLTNQSAVEKLRQKRFRRVPVYDDVPDNIVGILDGKDLLEHPEVHFTELMVSPSFVPETMKALDLLKSFLRHPQAMAVIVDEFGGTEGIITLSDIVEEILGDAAPSGDKKLYIEPLTGGKLLVSGSTRLDDLGEFGIHLEAEGLDTVGGLIFNRLGFLPQPGATLQLDGHTLLVRRTVRKRITEVLIAPRSSQSQEADE